MFYTLKALFDLAWYIFTLMEEPVLKKFQWNSLNVLLLNVLFNIETLQQAAHHPEVGKELRSKALQFGSECTTGYINLLEQVLQVGMMRSCASYINDGSDLCLFACGSAFSYVAETYVCVYLLLWKNGWVIFTSRR